MADPYRILGVEKDASDEEVKTAYRNLAKKYHPDAYENNPLADLAAQKMGEINEAYDKIMEMRRGSGIDASATQESYQAGGESTGRENYAQIRQFITAGNLSEAENMLNRIPSDIRSSEWNFLMGSVNYSKGWLDQASRFFAEAVRIEPNNQEYRAAYNRMMWQQGGGTNGNPYASGANTGCSVCDMCSALLCADCCCNCMGGGMRC